MSQCVYRLPPGGSHGQQGEEGPARHSPRPGGCKSRSGSGRVRRDRTSMMGRAWQGGSRRERSRLRAAEAGRLLLPAQEKKAKEKLMVREPVPSRLRQGEHCHNSQ